MGENEALELEATDTHWVITWSLNDFENYGRFAMESGGGWMARLVRYGTSFCVGTSVASPFGLEQQNPAPQCCCFNALYSNQRKTQCFSPSIGSWKGPR
jgi:hypothetical protein